MARKQLTLGDLLKSEADYNSREAIAAPIGTKIGQLVTHPERQMPLVALSDEEGGKVLVQPSNCVIYLDNVTAADVAAYEHQGAPLTVETLKQQGDVFGIKYIGAPSN